MRRPIISFDVDPQGDPRAWLSCGHAQHVRHQPPFTNRPWTQTEAGREQMLGSELDCLKCERLEAPEALQAYKSTPWFDSDSVPAGLLEDHSTKPGVWGRIEIRSGELDYEISAPFEHRERLSPDTPGWVVPQAVHRVSPVGEVCFRVTFLRSQGPVSQGG